jgi:hypothetical protein
MIDIQIVLIIAGICMLVGVVFGYLFGSVGKRKGQEPATRGEDQDAPVQVEDPERQGMIEVVRFWTDEDGKKVVPEVGGRMIHSIKELDTLQRARLTRLMDQLRLGPPAAPQEPAAAPTPTLRPPDQKPSSPEAASSGLPVNVPPAVVEPPASPPNLSMLSALGRSLQPEIGRAPVAHKSIAAQIDEVLQEMLEGTPLAQKGIRLMELPGKGMVVLVGMEQYPGVGDVPDPDVRQAIRAAVAAWENKVTPD